MVVIECWPCSQESGYIESAAAIEIIQGVTAWMTPWDCRRNVGVAVWSERETNGLSILLRQQVLPLIFAGGAGGFEGTHGDVALIVLTG